MTIWEHRTGWFVGGLRQHRKGETGVCSLYVHPVAVEAGKWGSGSRAFHSTYSLACVTDVRKGRVEGNRARVPHARGVREREKEAPSRVAPHSPFAFPFLKRELGKWSKKSKKFLTFLFSIVFCETSSEKRPQKILFWWLLKNQQWLRVLIGSASFCILSSKGAVCICAE